MEERIEKLYPYRWAILINAFLVHTLLQIAILITPGMGSILMGPDVGMSPMEFAAIATMPYLTGFLFGILSGQWADRKSIRFVMIVGLIAATIGAAVRCISMATPVLIFGSFIMGFALAALNANSAKIFRLWFPGKMTSITMGIYIFGATIGGAIAFRIGPTLSDAHVGFMIGAVATAVALVCWIVLGRTHPDGESDGTESGSEALRAVIKNKYVWLIGFIMFFVFGASIIESDYLNAGLVNYVGDPALAGSMGSINMIAVGIGGVVMPIIISPLKKLKPVFFIAAICFLVSCLLIFTVPVGPWTWVILISQGIFMGVMLPMGKTLPALIPDVKREHLGAVGGFQSSMQNLGAFLLPAYVVAPICTAAWPGSFLALVGAAGVAGAIAGILFLVMPGSTSTYVEANIEGKN